MTNQKSFNTMKYILETLKNEIPESSDNVMMYAGDSNLLVYVIKTKRLLTASMMFVEGDAGFDAYAKSIANEQIITAYNKVAIVNDVTNLDNLNRFLGASFNASFTPLQFIYDQIRDEANILNRGTKDFATVLATAQRVCYESRENEFTQVGMYSFLSGTTGIVYTISPNQQGGTIWKVSLSQYLMHTIKDDSVMAGR